MTTTRLLLPALVLLSVLLPRLMLLGGYPATDDGFYTYSAMLAHRSLSAGDGLPYHGMLLLYPTLLSWVFAFDYNPFFALRFMDMLVAATAALLLYRLLAQESGSRIAGALLAAAFTFILNTYPFIQSGFRNSQFAAYIPLLLAISLALHKPAQTTRDWLLCGALLALCVLLRENFVPFAVYGTLYLFFWKGFRPATAFVTGGTLTGIVIIGIMLTLRGGVEGLITSYQEMGAINDVEWRKNLVRFLRNLDIAKGIALPVLVIALFSLLLPCLRRQTVFYRTHFWRILFWLGLAFVPLIEPMLKKGVTYHYSVGLIGLAGLSALLARQLTAYPQKQLRYGAAVLGVVFLFMSGDRFSELHQQFTERTVPNMVETAGKGWSEKAHRESRYLQMADIIQQEMPQGGNLSISGNLYGLYVLTGFLPSNDALKNIGLLHGISGTEGLLNAFRDCPPDILYLAEGELKPKRAGEIIDSMRIYHLVKRFRKNANHDYGHFAGAIYGLETVDSPEVHSCD